MPVYINKANDSPDVRDIFISRHARLPGGR